ncbi:hypothetical protein Micbo1qcDRAFT_205314 [Microdochium bolleyi]|uniref:BTB domain-containing protein n=1 Tax=Microdochium bolleyi TaxID=196109 RepID=A0A136IZU6_9PEZI|nr:hypothetical protein Micbo1qcDRAFT_205314 [Microdochium bolleyi]
MKRSRFEQDPDGDVDLVLHDPDGLRREWPGGYKDEEPDDAENSESEVVDDYDERPAKRFRVSSRHLSLASPVFQQMLNGPWKEATSAATGSNERREIEASEWDTEATVVLMDIIHGHFSQVPRVISLELLAKIAILVDYYKCHEIVCLFSSIWIAELKKRETVSLSLASAGIGVGATPGRMSSSGGSVPLTSGGGPAWTEDCFLWLFVSWVFGDEQQFCKMADVFLRSSPLPISSIVFPLPEDMLNSLDSSRDAAIEQVLSGIEKLRNDLCDGRANCPYGLQYECSSMLLGALTKGMRSLGLSPPLRMDGHPMRCSLQGMQFSFARLRRPVWFHATTVFVPPRTTPVPHQCNLRSRLDALVRAVLEGLPKFQLADFPSSALRRAEDVAEAGEQLGQHA